MLAISRGAADRFTRCSRRSVFNSASSGQPWVGGSNRRRLRVVLNSLGSDLRRRPPVVASLRSRLWPVTHATFLMLSRTSATPTIGSNLELLGTAGDDCEIELTRRATWLCQRCRLAQVRHRHHQRPLVEPGMGPKSRVGADCRRPCRSGASRSLQSPRKVRAVLRRRIIFYRAIR